MNKLLPTLLLFVSVYLQAQCPGTYQATLDANNVSASFIVPEALFWDTDNSTYTVPKGSDKHPIFSGSIWMGGIDENNSLKVAASTYRQTGNDFFPGPLNEEGQILNGGCSNFNFAWQIVSDEVEAFVNSGFNEAYLTNNIKNWPGRNNPLFNMFNLPQDLDLAPFNDNNGDGIYNPLDGDTPVCKGNQNFWWIFNDKAGPHTETGGEKLGVQISAYAYSIIHSSSLDNTTFWEFDVTNKSGLDIADYYFGFFLDVDLGNYQDDFIGCIPHKNIAYGYNGDDFDEGPTGYGEEIPIVGIEILEGVKNDGIDTKMSGFMFYNGDFSVQGNPETAQHFYNVLQSKWKDGTQMAHPGTDGDGYGEGTPTTFMFPHYPNQPQPSWSECSWNIQPADRRFVASSGPGQLSNGATQSIKTAVYWVPDVPHPCPNISEYFSEASYWGNTVVNYFEYITSTSNIKQNLIQLSPNPASKQVSINSPQQAFNQVNIYTLNGQLVQSHKGFTNQLNIEDLPNGQYLISFTKNETRIATQKLVVLR